MSQSQPSPIDFHGNQLFVTEHNGEPYAPMRPIVEGMGLTWQSQHRKLSDNKERWGVIILMIPTASGSQDALCMPLRKLPAFFASISASKVRAELRATIILFQNECDDALWRYWMEKRQRPQIEQRPSPKPRPLLEPTTRLSKRGDPERKELHALVNTWVGCAPLHYAAANGIVNAYIGVKGVDEMTIEQVQTATWMG